MIFKPRNAAATAMLGLLGSLAALAAPAHGAVTPAPVTDFGSLATVAAFTGATDMWACGWTGRGVDVALIDTGVAPVAGTGNVVNGPDLSLEAQVGAPRSIDGDGHGTHLASIINGHDPNFAVDTSKCNAPKGLTTASPATGFSGIAPDARVVNMKVGDADGAVDVSQVIAAIDWVVQHRNTDGFNIRVLALAYGANDASQTWKTEPLSYAVDVARRNGIVVVAATGNDGSSATEVAFPAQNPNIVAVGAVDFHGTTDVNSWGVADFASRGSGQRGADVVAPGVSIEGLAVPGSQAAVNNPSSIVGGRFIKGSGTSQATAVVAGLSALLVQRYPTATPAQVKRMLTGSARKLKSASGYYQGAGAAGAAGLIKMVPAKSNDNGQPATGTGSLEPLRADGTMALNGIALTGEIDVQGTALATSSWATAAAAGTTWSGGSWRGAVWSGNAASGWAVAPWASNWAGIAWNNLAFAGPSWDGFRWSGATWSGFRWSGATWSGFRWSGFRWSGFRWSAASWT